MHVGFPEKKYDDSESRHGRQVFRNIKTEAVKYHNYAEHQYGIHRSVFQINILLDALYVPEGKLPHNNGSQTVPEQYQRNGKSKGKSTEHPVY